MKKTLILALFLLAAASSASAVDFGIQAANTTDDESTTGTNLFYQENSLSAWLSTPLGDWTKFSASGSYTFKATVSDGTTTIDPFRYAFDLERLSIEGSYPDVAGPSSILAILAGRTECADPTGLIFAQRTDGAMATLYYPHYSVSLQASYLGLQPKAVATNVISEDDQIDAADSDVHTAPPRFEGMTSANFNELFWRQDLTLFILGQFDMRKNPINKVNTQYFGFSLKGPVFSGLYWGSFATLENIMTSKGGASANYLSYMAGGNIRIFYPPLLGFNAQVDIVAASGKTGSFETFRPITSNPLGVAFAASASNILYADGLFFVKLGDTVQFGPRGAVYYRISTEALNIYGFSETSKDLYLGYEAGATIRWRPIADFGLTGTGAVFIPNTASGGTFESSTKPYFKLQVKATFSI
jgi:hypothetical protein